ncbi:MAG: chemotaxis protein [candidate division Zixibacteria bacterium CG_4_9_14_3_um_filter_46_8]|nr:MAG: chemotaxis protein [candidate division Zixibacteria bacterium CG_4_9_14_3_um_filter_46_8]
MDLNQAIAKHAEWKMKFRSAISRQETMDAVAISKDNCCEMGKWLYGEAKAKLSGLKSYAECVAKHAAFHIEAGKVAHAINAKKYAEAENMIGSNTPYMAASNAVGSGIIHLKKEAAL